MHPPGVKHLLLGGVPQVVVRLCALQLLARIHYRPLIMGMLSQRSMGPVGCALYRVVERIVVNEINRQFAPGYKLIQKIIFGCAWCMALLDCQSNRMWANMSEVKIRREPAGSIDFRLTVSFGIVRQLMPDEVVATA